MHLATGWFGVVLVEGTSPVASRLFPADPAAIAERLERLLHGEVLDEERAMAAQAGGAFTVHEARLLGLAGATRGPLVDVWGLAPRVGVAPGLHKRALHELARHRIRDALADPDRHVMEAVTALDEVNDTLNLLGERLQDWCGLYAPELVAAAPDPGALARALVQTTDRDALAKTLGADVDATLGAPMTPAELAALQSLASALLAAESTRAKIEHHLDDAVRKLAPNLCILVGPKLGGRFIHLAGGLHRLARLPSSTVQTLGAENALFRHIVAGTPPPKHGVIYQHPLVHRALPRLRGRIARMFAGRISIAARADATTRRPIGHELKAHVEAQAHRQHARARSQPTGRPHGSARGRRR